MMRVIKGAKNKKVILLKIAILAFVIYVVCILVNQQLQISAKKRELQEINNKLSIQEIKNDEIKRVADSSGKENEEYIESIARESLDLTKQGERVFVNIAGD